MHALRGAVLAPQRPLLLPRQRLAPELLALFKSGHDGTVARVLATDAGHHAEQPREIGIVHLRGGYTARKRAPHAVPRDDIEQDLRGKLALTFESGKDAAERDAARRQLTTKLRAALAPIIKERANALAGNDNPRVARWRRLLMAAQAARTWVEVDSAVEINLGYINASGRKSTTPALLDGITMVRAVDEHTFDLGIPLRGRGGITMVRIPYSLVGEICDDVEGRLHVLVNKTILLEDGTTKFI